MKKFSFFFYFVLFFLFLEFVKIKTNNLEDKAEIILLKFDFFFTAKIVFFLLHMQY